MVPMALARKIGAAVSAELTGKAKAGADGAEKVPACVIAWHNGQSLVPF
jgi:hypothetical protein